MYIPTETSSSAAAAAATTAPEPKSRQREAIVMPLETIKSQQSDFHLMHDQETAQPQGIITAAESADAFQQAEYGVEVAQISESESDAGYETDSSGASTSLASSARQYIYEHGRRYHSYRDSEGQYSFPNDELEQDREDLKHAMFLKLFNKTLHLAPIDSTNAINVIDLGTGTGIWAIDCKSGDHYDWALLLIL
jgi:hypothetical protein